MKCALLIRTLGKASQNTFLAADGKVSGRNFDIARHISSACYIFSENTGNRLSLFSGWRPFF
jgi:hypothetical protein